MTKAEIRKPREVLGCLKYAPNRRRPRQTRYKQMRATAATILRMRAISAFEAYRESSPTAGRASGQQLSASNTPQMVKAPTTSHEEILTRILSSRHDGC